MIQQTRTFAIQEASASHEGVGWLNAAGWLLSRNQNERAREGPGPTSATPSEDGSDNETPTYSSLQQKIIREIERQLPNIVSKVCESILPHLTSLITPSVDEHICNIYWDSCCTIAI